LVGNFIKTEEAREREEKRLPIDASVDNLLKTEEEAKERERGPRQSISQLLSK